MKLSVAVSLIKKGVDHTSPRRWADLGAGKGLFTRALVALLEPGSTIYAVDKSELPDRDTGILKRIDVHPIKADFTTGLQNISNVDGILMANSLHFINDKVSLLKHLSTHLTSPGRFIIIEYDTDKSNTWVPYPISFNKLKDLVESNEVGTIEKIGAADSAYQKSGMYSALIT